MVEREKVVVILLLITIILSIVSAVMTLTLNVQKGESSSKTSVKAGQIDNLKNAFAAETGQVSFEVKKPSS
jgi:flagellar basal body-associated protein FliL